MTIPYGPRYRAAMAALFEWGERTGRLAEYREQLERERLERERNGANEQDDAVSLDAAEMATTAAAASLPDELPDVAAISAAVSADAGEGE